MVEAALQDLMKALGGSVSESCILPARRGMSESLLFAQELHKRYPEGLPELDPVEDMGIRNPALSNALADIKSMKAALRQNPIQQARMLLTETEGSAERHEECRFPITALSL